LIDTAAVPRGAVSEAAQGDEPEEIKDSAFWEAYADRSGIPAAGLLEVAPPPGGERRASPAVDPDEGPTLWRQGVRDARATVDDVLERRQRGRRAWAPEEPERRPSRIVAVTVIAMIVMLTAVFLSTEFWPGGLSALTRWIAPPDRQAVSSRPALDPVPVPTEPAAPSEPAAVTEGSSTTDATVSTEAAPPAPAAPSKPAAASLPAAPAAPAPGRLEGPGRSGIPPRPQEPASTPGPSTSVERMATFLIGRDGPERAVQTALTVAKFYPANTDDFKYWHGVAAAIRASTARTGERDEGVRR
jgi:hypothetical protein